MQVILIVNILCFFLFFDKKINKYSCKRNFSLIKNADIEFLFVFIRTSFNLFIFKGKKILSTILLQKSFAYPTAYIKIKQSFLLVDYAIIICFIAKMKKIFACGLGVGVRQAIIFLIEIIML